MINLNLNFNFQEANKKTGPNFKISKSVSRKKGAETLYTHLRLFISDYRLLGILMYFKYRCIKDKTMFFLYKES